VDPVIVRISSVLIVVLALTRPAAGNVSKEACLTAHSRGQDVQEQGKLSLARKLFLTCAQAACPALVRDDCAREVDELARMLPTLTFAARDRGGADLPDTAVYVDEILTATRLDDGKAYEVDPGRHVVKFVHGSTDQVVTIVVGAGEKGRSVVASFGGAERSVRDGGPLALGSKSVTAKDRLARGATRDPESSRGGAKVVMALGGIVAVGGSVIAVIGLAKVPPTCSFQTHECAASPGDPVFTQASSAVRITNVGLLTAAIGLTALTGGVVWYLTAEPNKKERRVVAPWIMPDAGGMTAGLATSGRF
jgi:hypothetical protein